MDAVSATTMNQAMLQQTLTVAAIKQAEVVPQAAAQMLANATSSIPEGNASSVPTGATGRVLDILA